MENVQTPQPSPAPAGENRSGVPASFLMKPAAVYCVIGWLAFYAVVNFAGAWAMHKLAGYHDLAAKYDLLSSLDLLAVILAAAGVCNLGLAVALYLRSRVFRIVAIVALCFMCVNNLLSLRGPQGALLPLLWLAGNMAAAFILFKTGWFFKKKDRPSGN